MKHWDQRSRLNIAILVDVDGTLAGPYRAGQRALRPSAHDALKMSAQHAPTFLWSIAGAENGLRLIQEYPEIKPYVTGSFGKEEFPLHLVEKSFAIDDEGIDDAVERCRHVVLIESYDGGEDSDCLMEAVKAIVNAIREQV